jgi:hypothetical protein
MNGLTRDVMDQKITEKQWGRSSIHKIEKRIVEMTSYDQAMISDDKSAWSIDIADMVHGNWVRWVRLFHPRYF